MSRQIKKERTMKKEKRDYGDGLSYVGRYVDLMFDKGFKRIA